jgi:hypothetical protein
MKSKKVDWDIQLKVRRGDLCSGNRTSSYGCSRGRAFGHSMKDGFLLKVVLQEWLQEWLNNGFEPPPVLTHLGLYYMPFLSLEPESESREPYLFSKVPDYSQTQISKTLGIQNGKPDRVSECGQNFTLAHNMSWGFFLYCSFPARSTIRHVIYRMSFQGVTSSRKACSLLKDRSLVLTWRVGPVINSRACHWVLVRQRLCPVR